ncbi:MAG: DUF3820 family protein [Bacteroidota bacterium]
MSVGNKLQKEHLIELANYEMPFGKYKDELLVNIPEYYYNWFRQKGFPQGKLGRFMQEMHEIKINGLEQLLRPLIR